MESQNVNLFINLITLWINLFSLSLNDNTFSIDEHTQIIKDEYSRYTGDPSKPNTAIEAKAAFQLIRFFLGDNPDTIADDIILILEGSSGHLDLDIRPLCRAIQEFPVFENTKRFPEMFERSVDIMSEQKRNIEAAKLLANRGRKLKDERPYDALIYFSRTLSKLYNEESKELLSLAVLDMADVFQSIGLFWAARNFYYYDFILCLNQYFKFGDVSPVLFMSAYSLKNIELRLGHVFNAIVFHRFSLIAEHIYPGEIRSNDDKDDNFDYVLALQLLRTPYETAKGLGEFPAFLDEQGLSFSRAAMKYELGHYDEEMLAELGGSTEVFDDVIGKWKDQPALKHILEGDRSVGCRHLTDAAAAHFVVLLAGHIHIAAQQMVCHVVLHRQLKQQPAQPVTVHTQCAFQHFQQHLRQEVAGLCGVQIAIIKPYCLFHKLTLGETVVLFIQ